MQSPAPLLFSLVIAGLVLFSGCTQDTSLPATAAPLPVNSGDLRALALMPSDLPPCFGLSAEQVKTFDDVGPLARDLGWEAGYAATFTCPAEENGEPTVILHSLAVYPAVNIPAVVSMVDMQDRSDPGLVYGNLTFSDTGMRGFYGRNNSGTPGNISGGQAGTGPIPRNEVAEIIIWRGRTFEVLRMSGPMTNTTLLSALARAALSKVP
jgi:hypothetical protein